MTQNNCVIPEDEKYPTNCTRYYGRRLTAYIGTIEGILRNSDVMSYGYIIYRQNGSMNFYKYIKYIVLDKGQSDTMKSYIDAKNNSKKVLKSSYTQNKTDDKNKSEDKSRKKIKLAFTIVISFLVGMINGLFGGGGGMLVVPVLTLLCNLDEQKAHSSAILTILPLSLVSGIVYLIRGDFELYTGGFVSLGVILGGLLGTFVMKKLSNNVLAIIFYGVMIFAGISMLVMRI